VLVLIVSNDNDAYDRRAGLALDAIVLISNILNRDARWNINV
jgi:hypothetical protein